MLEKKFILNADDFGLTTYHNQAVLEGHQNGILTSASLCANGEAYENAVHDIIPDCPDLGLATHLNIMEGKPLTNCPLLLNEDEKFKGSYAHLLLKQNDKEVLSQIEQEFRAQIEKTLNDVKIDHLDSHVHTHAIPTLFEITCKLAKEFNIPAVRTQFEELYFIPNLAKHLNFNYPLNIVKIMLLQYFTKINRKTLDKYELKTNDFIIGVGYTGMMDSDAIQYGLENLDESCVAEALIHPCKYNNSTKDSHTKEFAITQNMQLKDTISRLGFELVNYKNI